MILSADEIKHYLALLDKLPADAEEVEKIHALLQEDKRERCRSSFMPFVKQVWSSFVSGQHHQIMANAFERVANGELKRLIINMPPRHALSLEEEIPTTQGWKKVAAIAVGDYVFGPDGHPTMVTGKSPVTEGDLYEVTAIDGSKVVCDADHLWTVNFRAQGFQTYRTEDLYIRDQGKRLTKSPNGKVLIMDKVVEKIGRPAVLPINRAVHYQEKSLIVDPYVLGLWLKNGAPRRGIIFCPKSDAYFLRAEVERRGYNTLDQPGEESFMVENLSDELKYGLKILDITYIPGKYLIASIDQRLSLLQGLMDADGRVAKNGQCFFRHKDKRFIDQFRELLNSLGVKNTMQVYEPYSDDPDYGPTYRVSFFSADCCLLPRKRQYAFEPQEKNKCRSIRIKKLNKRGWVQCLKVEREDGLFLHGRGYLVGHNTKSEFASYLFPAWFLGRFPEKKIIQCAHTGELAVGFGRKVRNLVGSEDYRSVFETKLSADSKAAGRWNTDKGGEYFAIGVGGAVTGKGADILVIDDPHSEQEAMLGSPEVYDRVYEWYSSGPRQRLQPGGSIIIVATRWSKRDLTGKILDQAAKKELDEWEVIEFPALLPSGNPLWPQFWAQEELEAIKNELPVSKWEAQYQQNPTSEEGAIVKRDMWRIWEKDRPPACEYIIQAWDTAFEKHTRADYSACTTWGVFYTDVGGSEVANIILLDAFKDRLEFPELKTKAYEMLQDWSPDTLLVEKRASGAPLIYELRRMGIPVSEYTPSKGHDKIARLNSVSDLFASGMVWAPDRRWAEEVIEEVASFPNGEHDDLVDSTTLALMRFRQGGFIQLASDEEDKPFLPRKAAYY